LDGTTLYLTNIIGKAPSKLHIDLKALTPYDDRVAKVLAYYGVLLPIRQKSGTAHHAVVLDIAVASGETQYQGRSRIRGKSSFDLFGVPATIRKGEVAYDDHRVQLYGVETDAQWIAGTLNGTLDLPRKRASLKLDLKQITLGDSDPFFRMKNKYKIPVKIDWKGQPRIDIPLYKTHIRFEPKGGYRVEIPDIRPLSPYVRSIPFAITQGEIRVRTRNGKRFDFGGEVVWPSSYLYDKQGTITRFPFAGRYRKGGAAFVSLLDGRIVYDGAKKEVTLKKIYIDAKKMLTRKGVSTSTGAKMRILGVESLIRYDKYVLLTDRFRFDMGENKSTFVAIKDGDRVRADLKGKTLSVQADRIKAPMLRALIHFGGLQGGRYSLNLHGNIDATLYGIITIEGGIVSSFKTYNNVIALFNTVPELAALSDPGFSDKGFEVRSGRIEFRIVKNRIFFDMIYIDGKSAAISGKGTVSTINGAINMDLAVRTARGIGKLIGSLPVVGYILMGKDKSITTGVKITGTLDNPKVTTNVVMETLLAPFQMFIRTLKSPAHIINK
jgi:hypothetical protein